MTNELQNKLVEKYPEFFEYLKTYKGPMMPMVFGFECNDGWFTIIDTLMGLIQNHIKWNKDMKINLTQVKEKYGGLCFYYQGGGDEIYGMVRMAEAMSYRTCEFCGTNKNIGHTTGWIFTICKDCFDTGKTNQHEWKSLEQIEKEHKERESEEDNL